MVTSIRIDAAALAETAQSLPALPPTTTRIISLVEDPFFDLGELSRLIELDPALSARVLRLANSAASGSQRTVSSARDAALMLGPGTIVALAISASAQPSRHCDLSAFGLTTHSYWNHCLGCVATAEEMTAQKVAQFGAGFCTAALLHDFGKQILAHHMNASRLQALREYREAYPGRAAIEAEREILGVDHAMAGGLVARHWQLAEEVATAIERHHDVVDWQFLLSHGIVVANDVSHELEGDSHFCHTASEHMADAMLALDITDAQLQTIVAGARPRLDGLKSLFQ